MNLKFYPLLLLAFVSCQESTQGTNFEDDFQEESKKMVSLMDIKTNPEELIFSQSDTIRFVLDCFYDEYYLTCGYGEIRYLIDETIDLNKVFEDSLYQYEYCHCGDTVQLVFAQKGNHYISANFSWHTQGVSLTKNWRKEIIIN